MPTHAHDDDPADDLAQYLAWAGLFAFLVFSLYLVWQNATHATP
jgi:tryptophan-rich sensory protein